MRHLPLHQIAVCTRRLVVRLPDLAELDELAEIARVGLFEPGDPLTFAWHVPDPDERARNVVSHGLRCVGSVEPGEWRLPLAVFDAQSGAVMGCQGLAAQEFPVLGEVATGSWLGREWRGQGVGREMRTAVLALACELGAEWAVSGAFPGNEASLGVSRALGYLPDGIEHVSEGEVRQVLLRQRLDLRTWEPAEPVELELPRAARELLGARVRS